MLEYLNFGFIVIGVFCASMPILAMEAGGYLLGLIMYWLSDMLRFELLNFIDSSQLTGLFTPNQDAASALLHALILCTPILLASKFVQLIRKPQTEPSPQ